MRSDRTDYFRDYAEKNREKRRAISAAYRARAKDKIAAYRILNKEKIAAYARAYRASRTGADVDDERKAAVRKPRPIKPAPKTVEAKAEAFQTLRERFAAFRAVRKEAE